MQEARLDPTELRKAKFCKELLSIQLNRFANCRLETTIVTMLITVNGLDGKKIQNFDVLLNCLEAGQIAYNERGKTYEILKD